MRFGLLVLWVLLATGCASPSADTPVVDEWPSDEYFQKTVQVDRPADFASVSDGVLIMTIIHPSAGDLQRLHEYPDLKDLCLVGDPRASLPESELIACLENREFRSLIIYDANICWRTLEACALCPTLRYLSLSWCEGIGQPMIDAFRQLRPDVIVLFGELREPTNEPTVHPDPPISPTSTKPIR